MVDVQVSQQSGLTFWRWLFLGMEAFVLGAVRLCLLAEFAFEVPLNSYRGALTVAVGATFLFS